MNKDTYTPLCQAVELYFNSIFEADEQKMRQIFTKDCKISGFFGDDYVQWSLDDFVSRLKGKPSPKQAGDPFRKEIMSIEQKGNIAFVKAFVLAFEYEFIDFLILEKRDNIWKIKHKSFTTSSE